MALGLPYDGWYNGSAKLMIANGTYADFRHNLVERVELKKLKQADLDSFDEEWASVPDEEKLRRRALVVEDTTPKPITFYSPKGPVTVHRSKPSDNNNLDPARNRTKGKKEVRRPKGALTDENNPLLSPAK